MNITVDDTSPNFIWGSGDVWRAQPPNQVTQNSNFFLNTYHAAQAKNANVTITFVGSAFYIYGSTGANHGKYSVNYDGTIKYTSGFSTQTQYRQLLFSNVFGTTAETHTVVIKNEEDFWFDLDFMVLTISTTADTATTDIGFFASTVTAATAVPSSESSGSGNVASTSSDSASGSIFRIVSFVFAGVIALLIFGILGWVFCRRQRQRRAAAGANQGSQQEHLKESYKQGISLDTTLDGKETLMGGKAAGGFTRGRGAGKDDMSYMQTPTSMSITAADHHTQLGYPPESASVASGSGSAVSGAARETLIALNNMGRRPGYRNLPSETGGRETPNSTRSLGSAGQVWLGANNTGSNASHRESRLRNGMRHESLLNIGQGSDAGASTRGGASRSNTRGQRHQRRQEDDYVTEEIGLGIYGTNNRSDPDQRMADLRRSASVASSGILDRITSSPPPAVPELPPSLHNGSYVSSNNTSNNRLGVGMQRSGSPVNSIDSHTDGYSALSFASKVHHPYGKGNEMLVSSHASIGSTVTTGTGVGGAMPLRPPPARIQQEDRARALKEQERERERLEQERRTAPSRYSRPPPEYAPTAPTHEPLPPPRTVADPTSPDATGSFGLRRQGTRTGDIPIALEGGFGAGDPVDNESYESHSQAYVGAATQVNVAASIARNQPPVNTSPFAQQQASQVQHIRNGSAMGSNSSLAATITNTSITTSKRAVTPDRGRMYTPDRTMAIPANDRGYAVGRPSEDRVWTLDGVSSSAQRTGAPPGNVGRPIMDDRARLAAISNSTTTTNRPMPRIPPS
ncbi:hypothetical protein FRB91_009594 [Serendipita sp. 411]|nr:hypothetical protein FRB91_009594 [Serendipita sp. 411]